MSYSNRLFARASVIAVLSAMGAATAPGCGFAQTSAQPATSEKSKTVVPTDATEVATVTIEAGKNRSAIIPTATNAFGLNQSLVETPRSVTTVSLAMIDQYSLRTVRDLIAVAPGVFTATFYGVDGTVDIRGEYADNYFRDFKRVENQGTYQTPIESALDLDIVRGVPSPAYGAGRAGGYVDFKPHSDRAERFMNGQEALGEIDTSVGTYTAYNLTGEYGAPLKLGSQDAGFDVWVEHNRAPEYFYGIVPEHTMLQAGFATGLGAGWTLDTGMQYFTSTGLAGTTGLNRLTQNLINNDIYTSGSFLQQIVPPGGKYITPNDINNMVGVSASPGVSQYFGFTSPYSTLDPATIKSVHLNYRDIITSAYDFGNAETPTAYIDLDRTVGAGTLKIQIFGDGLKADSYNGYGFAKSLRDYAYEGRVSYSSHYNLTPWLTTDYATGIGYRYYKADESYDYALGYMVLDRQDISVGWRPDSIFNPIYATRGAWDQIFHSREGDASIFINTSTKIFKNFDLTFGARYDQYNVQSINDGQIDYSVNTNQLYKASEGQPSYSVSLSYTTPFGVVPYVTYGKNYALETTQGGALQPGDVAGHTFLSPSELREVGIKGSFLNSHLFFSLADYYQQRVQLQMLGAVAEGVTSRGQEAELRWAIDRHFAISAVATHEITYNSGCSYLYATPQQVGVPNVDGWGYAYEVATCNFAGEVSGYRDRTQPEWVLGLFGNYEVGNGLGFTFGGTYVSQTRGELPDTIYFPGYYLFRGSAHYDFGRYRVSVYVDNITDTRYYIPQRSSETEGTTMPGEGRTAFIKLTTHF